MRFHNLKENKINKYRADTYFYGISRIVLFLASVLAVSVLFLVSRMRPDPDLFISFYDFVPEMIKNNLAICLSVVGAGLFFEIKSS